MPQRKTALKKLRVDKKRHLRNLIIKTDLKKGIKKFQALLSSKKLQEAKSALIEIISKLDKAAKKNILHKNTARRKISRLSKRLNKASR